jgi:hypothetical protein
VFRVSVHEEPLQAPPKVPKVEPEPAVAVSVTDVPGVNFATHEEGQAIPAGLLVIVPLPVTVTVR